MSLKVAHTGTIFLEHGAVVHIPPGGGGYSDIKMMGFLSYLLWIKKAALRMFSHKRSTAGALAGRKINFFPVATWLLNILKW